MADECRFDLNCARLSFAVRAQSFIGSRLVLDPDAAAESNLFASIPTSSSGSHNDDALAAAESAPAKCADIAGGMLLACMPSIGQVTHVSQAGALSKDAMAEVEWTFVLKNTALFA